MNNICINQVGRYYNSHCHSQIVCEEVLHLNHRGASQGEIARKLKTSRGVVRNVVSDYNQTGSAVPVSQSNPPSDSGSD